MYVKLRCWTNIFSQNDSGFNLVILQQLHLVNDDFIVYILWNQLLLHFLLEISGTLRICYKHIEDMHVQDWSSKFFFWQNGRVFNLAIFWQLHIVSDG